MNSMVSSLLTIITGRLSPRNFECTHGLKQSSNQSDNQSITNKMIMLLEVYR